MEKDLDSISLKEITYFLSPAHVAFTDDKIYDNLDIEKEVQNKRKKAIEILINKFLLKPSEFQSFILFHLKKISSHKQFKHLKKLYDSILELSSVATQDVPLNVLFRKILKTDEVGVRYDHLDGWVETKNVENGLKHLIESLGFTERPPQTSMAKEVNETFNKNEVLIIEAPTGTGKSLGYLVPAVFHSFHTKQPIIISSYTKALQFQLFKKEIKYLKNIFQNFKATLLFGRENYPCILMLKTYFDEINGLIVDKKYLSFLGIILQLLDSHLENTIPSFIFPEKFTDENNFLAIFNEISAKRENCIGKKCPFFNQCPYYMAIKNMKDANVVIVNHWNLISHVLEKNIEDIKVVIDEADKFEGAATSSFSLEISSYYIYNVLKKISTHRGTTFKNLESLLWETGKISSREKIEFLKGLKSRVEKIRRKLNNFSKKQNSEETFEIDLYEEDKNEEYADIYSLLEDIKQRLMALMEYINDFYEELKDKIENIYILNTKFLNTLDDIKYIYDTINRALNKSNFFEDTYWVAIFSLDKNGGWSLNILPILVDELLKKYFYPGITSMVFTSATIKVENSPQYFVEMLGLKDFKFTTLPGVFDFQNQMKVFVASDLPRYEYANISLFRKEASSHLLKMVEHFKGKTLILFSSYSDMYYVYNHLKNHTKDVEVLKQESSMWAREYINEKFKMSKNSVLLGVKAYWYGVDFPGDILQYLVLFKMPYLPPNDIFVKKRMEFIDNYLTKDAKLSFKQAVGRLIRTENDMGVVIILDSRIMESIHRKIFLEELPKNVDVELLDYHKIIEKIDNFLK